MVLHRNNESSSSNRRECVLHPLEDNNQQLNLKSRVNFPPTTSQGAPSQWPWMNVNGGLGDEEEESHHHYNWVTTPTSNNDLHSSSDNNRGSSSSQEDQQHDGSADLDSAIYADIEPVS